MLGLLLVLFEGGKQWMKFIFLRHPPPMPSQSANNPHFQFPLCVNADMHECENWYHDSRWHFPGMFILVAVFNASSVGTGVRREFSVTGGACYQLSNSHSVFNIFSNNCSEIFHISLHSASVKFKLHLHSTSAGFQWFGNSMPVMSHKISVLVQMF